MSFAGILSPLWCRVFGGNLGLWDHALRLCMLAVFVRPFLRCCLFETLRLQALPPCAIYFFCARLFWLGALVGSLLVCALSLRACLCLMYFCFFVS